MNLTISGHHIEVTPPLRDYVSNKLERVARHSDKVLDFAVLLSVDNEKEKELRQKASCTVRFMGRDLFVEVAEADLYAAIDVLADKLDRKIGKYKEKNTDQKRTVEPIKYME